MRLGIQYGFNAGSLSHTLLKRWGGGTVVLSPRDSSDEQLMTIAKKLRGVAGARLVLDPQFYSPDADHGRLCEHDYWPKDFESGRFWADNGVSKLVRDLAYINSQVGTSEILLPTELVRQPREIWFKRARQILKLARDLSGAPATRLTVAIGSELLCDREAVIKLLSGLSLLECRRFYLIFERPAGSGYFVDNPEWLFNCLDISAHLHQIKASVTVGYCNQQALILAVANVDEIYSGHWNNVRIFGLDKFHEKDSEEIRRSTPWLYIDTSLSEIKRRTIGRLTKTSERNRLAALCNHQESEVTAVLAGASPTSSLKQTVAFRQYLDGLRRQAENIDTTTYENAKSSVRSMLDTASVAGDELHSLGLGGDGREFSSCWEAVDDALGRFDKTWGPLFRRKWR